MTRNDLPKILKTDSISPGKWKSIFKINHSGRLYSVRRVALYLVDACPFNRGLKLLNQKNESLRSQHSKFRDRVVKNHLYQ